jgi:hypothetical protein
MSKEDQLLGTRELMGALVRMKPKPHYEMKTGKKKADRATKTTGKKKSTR